MSDEMKFTATSVRLMYRCEKHGVINSCVSLFADDILKGEYCMECYKDWISANLLPVVRV